MNILLLGSGGREHAFAWKLTQSPLCSQLFIAPGNPGTANLGNNISLDILDFKSIEQFCADHQIKMIVVGPEEPLVRGIYDYFQQEHLQSILVIGPSQAAAALEGSKSFAKQFMQRHLIPTAPYAEFSITNYDEGVNYIQTHTLPIVLKADGLAAGKGVVIAHTHDEALVSFHEMIQEKKFGEASTTVVIESFLSGIECSSFVLTNGEQYVILPYAKDYKRIGEGDTGLNTGGMGAISPVPFADEVFQDKVRTKIIERTIAGLSKDKLVYKGFIFIGLIKVQDEPYVIEYNCRMGDPETEVVLPRLKNDLVDLFSRLHANTLNEVHIEHEDQHAATIVLVSGGYPEKFEKGKKILGLDTIKNCIPFHAGTVAVDNNIYSHGGRVLALTSLANTLHEAIVEANKNADVIEFENKYYRKDIGWDFEAS
jgi:phosphoribosylamine--glycine ligase